MSCTSGDRARRGRRAWPGQEANDIGGGRWASGRLLAMQGAVGETKHSEEGVVATLGR